MVFSLVADSKPRTSLSSSFRRRDKVWASSTCSPPGQLLRYPPMAPIVLAARAESHAMSSWRSLSWSCRTASALGKFKFS